MAQNNSSSGRENYLRYMRECLLDVVVAHSDQSVLRQAYDKWRVDREVEGPQPPHWLSLLEVEATYINRIDGFPGPAQKYMRLEGEIIGEWHIVGLETQFNPSRRMYNPKLIYCIRHLHLRSDLTCATFHHGPKEWYCCTCGEQVPIGIIWAARTQAIRRATE